MDTGKRHPIKCKICGTKMVFANEILRASKGGDIHLKYICPKRRGESGCGARRTVRFNMEPSVKLRKTEGGHFLRA